jgi:hypothetical protein
VKIVRTSDVTGAVPFHGRTPAVRLVLDERGKLLREAARRHCVGMSERQAARYIHDALKVYSLGRWRRDASGEPTCPAQYKGTLREFLFLLLRTKDRVPSFGTVRRALATREPEGVPAWNLQNGGGHGTTGAQF